MSHARSTASSDEDCGTTGNVSDRIYSCSLTHGKKYGKDKYPWTLVTKTKNGHEVWQDDSSMTFERKLVANLWGDFAGLAKDAEASAVCTSSLQQNGGGIPQTNWQMPSEEEYVEAELHGIRDVVPNMFGNTFRTRSVRGKSKHVVFYDANIGKTIFPWSLDKVFKANVPYRCVGQVILN